MLHDAPSWGLHDHECNAQNSMMLLLSATVLHCVPVYCDNAKQLLLVHLEKDDHRKTYSVEQDEYKAPLPARGNDVKEQKPLSYISAF